MNNNEQILNNLIGNSSQSPQNPNAVPTGTDDEVLITTARVVSIRYKAYVVVIALLAFILWQSFIMPLFDKIKAKSTELDNVKMEIAKVEAKEKEYEDNMLLVDQILEMEPTIVSCVNSWEWCKEIPEILQDNDNFSVARSYILLWDMTDEKMEINEKKIVENIDSFLLKNYWDDDNLDSENMLSKNNKYTKDSTSTWDQTDSQEINDDKSESKENIENTDDSKDDEKFDEDKLQDDEDIGEIDDEDIDEDWDEDNEDEDESQGTSGIIWEKNGTINKIIIWDEQKFNETLSYVPIELSINFDNKDGLMSFINNVEKRIPEEEEKDVRLLYKISKITYDVVNYNKNQETTILMNLYYYKK